MPFSSPKAREAYFASQKGNKGMGMPFQNGAPPAPKLPGSAMSGMSMPNQPSAPGSKQRFKQLSTLIKPMGGM